MEGHTYSHICCHGVVFSCVISCFMSFYFIFLCLLPSVFNSFLHLCQSLHFLPLFFSLHFVCPAMICITCVSLSFPSLGGCGGCGEVSSNRPASKPQLHVPTFKSAISASKHQVSSLLLSCLAIGLLASCQLLLLSQLAISLHGHPVLCSSSF